MRFLFCLVQFIVFIALSESAKAESEIRFNLSIADTNNYGSYPVFRYSGWRFSPNRPATVSAAADTLLTIPVNLRYMSQVRSLPNWNGYAWFEQVWNVDSLVAKQPLMFSYYSQGGIRIWVNGKLTLESGNPSVKPEDEVLSRYLNPVRAMVRLVPGKNVIWMEYSERTFNFQLGANMPNVLPEIINLYMREWADPVQRRIRSFAFGGSLLLLITIIIVHGFLVIQFRESYHLYVMLTVMGLLVHSFVMLSDTLINWTFAVAPIFEFATGLSLIFIIYFLIISIRIFFKLNIPWKTLSSLLGLFSLVTVISLLNANAYELYVSGIPLLSGLSYGLYSVYEAKKQSRENQIGIVTAGFIATFSGALLYVVVYVAFHTESDFQLITATLFGYCSMPIALTLNVAKSYAVLFKTLEQKVSQRTEQLRAANVELEKAGEYKSRFFANISHEFRTPLTIAQGLIDRILQKESIDSALVNELVPVKRNLKRLGNMVNQIVDLTKSDHNKMTLHPKPWKAESLAVIAVESFRSLAEFRKQILDFTSDTNESVILADRSKVEIMMNNLISNAIKYTHEGGWIRVHTFEENGNYIFSVEDNGKGIPINQQEAIFERFHRIKQSADEYVEGMGIGLELSRTLARLHNGEITLEKNRTKGSCFYLSLPLSEEVVQPNEEDDELFISRNQNSAIISTHSNLNKILLVEDNPDMAAYVRDVLLEVADVEWAKNGKEAIIKLQEFSPDLLVTDLMMPEMDGTELVKWIHQQSHFATLPIIVLTAKVLESDKLDLLRIGVGDYITKPFLADELMLKSKNLLRLAQRRIELAKLERNEPNESVNEIELIDENEKLTPKAETWVKENINNQSLSIETLADFMGISRRTLYRVIEAETGMTTAEFIREIRLQMARSFLQLKKFTTLESVSEAVGYASARNFKKLYQERFGVHPLDEIGRG